MQSRALKTPYSRKLNSARLKYVYHVIHFLFLAVSGVVLPQRSHQNHGHQAHQENDHHEGVEDGEPVNLGAKRQAQP